MSQTLKNIAGHLRGLADALESFPERDDSSESRSRSPAERELAEPDALRIFFTSADDYHETVSMARTCRSPKDIRSRIYTPLRRKGYAAQEIGRREFVVALLPHLCNYSGSKDPKNLQRQLY